METVNVAELVERLGSDEDAVRKMAVFKLQSNIGDPSFADIFIAEGGLIRLRYLTLHASGNTLAYSLTSFSRLLDVDKGWECVDQELVERVSYPGTHCSALYLCPCSLSAVMSDANANVFLDCRADRHPSPGQYPPRRHVYSRLYCFPPVHGESRVPGQQLWLPCPEACNRHLPPVSGNACQPIILCGPCIVC